LRENAFRATRVEFGDAEGNPGTRQFFRLGTIKEERPAM